jgi:phenylalanyl-tRNA synthetase beta chain
MRVGVVLMGDRRPAHFTEPRPPAFDQWDAKFVAERVTSAAFPSAGSIQLVSSDAGNVTTLWYIDVDGERRGAVTRLDIELPEWATTAYGVELTLGVVSSADVAPHGQHAGEQQAATEALSFVRHKPLPTTPSADFDIALLVPDGVSAADVERAIRGAAGELLEQIQLFDEYRGANLDAGTRSLAWRLTLRHPQHTLKEKEIEGRRSRILEILAKDLGIRARAT